MNSFMIDKELCTKCGLCAKDCPSFVIDMKDYPVQERDGCLKCSHCLAICPEGALSILGKSAGESTLLKGRLPTPEQMKTLVKGRRSVRQYRDEELAPETISELLDIVAHAPTGVNMQSVLFTVIDNRETMTAFRNEVYTQVEARLPAEARKGDHAMEFLIFAVQDRKENGSDILFRGAPHLLIASSPKATPCPEADTHIALAYFELMAQSMGIGTLWDGMVKMALHMLPQLGRGLGIPKGHFIGYSMVFGKPAIEYQRTVERAPANVNIAGFRSYHA